MKKSTISVTDTAILAAFCMFLSVIEYLIPKPMPFMRLGLANLPILISLGVFPVSGVFLLALLKILGQGLINGTLFSYIFLFSAAGTFASTAVMLIVFYALKKRVSYVGISIAGAMASNAVQLLFARAVIFGQAAVLIAPPFLAVGLATSILLGLFTARFTAVSEWYAGFSAGSLKAADIEISVNKSHYPKFKFICGLIMIPAFVFQPNLLLITFEAVLFMILSGISGKRIRILPNIIMLAGITAANLITPIGYVLAEIGPVKITAGALASGLQKSFMLIGLIYISRYSIRQGLSFPGRIGSLVSLVFYYFERITEGERLGKEGLFSKLDQKILALYSAGNKTGASETKKPGAKAPGYIFSIILILIIWFLLFAGVIINSGI